MPGIITVNPAVFNDKRDAVAVAVNEGLRIFQEDTKFTPRFEPTDEQRAFFKGTAYADDPEAMKKTIVARIATFDTSVKPTPEQTAETRRLLGLVMEALGPKHADYAMVQKMDELLAAGEANTEVTAQEGATDGTAQDDMLGGDVRLGKLDPALWGYSENPSLLAATPKDEPAGQSRAGGAAAGNSLPNRIAYAVTGAPPPEMTGEEAGLYGAVGLAASAAGVRAVRAAFNIAASAGAISQQVKRLPELLDLKHVSDAMEDGGTPANPEVVRAVYERLLDGAPQDDLASSAFIGAFTSEQGTASGKAGDTGDTLQGINALVKNALLMKLSGLDVSTAEKAVYSTKDLASGVAGAVLGRRAESVPFIKALVKNSELRGHLAGALGEVLGNQVEDLGEGRVRRAAAAAMLKKFPWLSDRKTGGSTRDDMKGGDVMEGSAMDATVSKVLDALETVESNRNPDAVGDQGRAVGILQMWNIATDEANRLAGKKLWSYEDRKNPQLSRAMGKVILESHYKRGVTDPVELGSRWRNPNPKKKPAPQWYIDKIKEALKD